MQIDESRSLGASPRAIQAHYDLGNDFYGLWLDEQLVYSGAMWEGDDCLAQAQRRKLDHHLREAGLQPGGHLLEVGCGWGALLRRAVHEFGAASATGLTLSRAQCEHVRQAQDPAIRVLLQSWQDHQVGQPYDAIVSIGAFEHFASLEMSDAEKVQNYRAFFTQARALLVPGGHMSLQTFAYGSARSRQEAMGAESTRFLAAEIFQETDPPRLANIAEAIEGRFELVRMHNDRQGYDRTCREWLRQLMQKRDRIVADHGQALFDQFNRYLSYSAIGFQKGYLDLYRITLKRL